MAMGAPRMEVEATEGAKKRPREDAEGAEQTEETPSTGTAGLAASPEMAKAVLATGADNDNLSAVVHSMMSGNIRCAEFLLNAGASPNTVDGESMRPVSILGLRSHEQGIAWT